MPRQNPNLLSSSASLQTAANAIRAAVTGGTFEDLKAGLIAAAGAFEQAQDAISKVEQRFRDLAEANPNDPRRPAAVLVSGDRIRGGVQVQGGLRSVMGQGLDVTFETQVAHVKSYDHGANGYLELDLDGSPVTINSHTGATTITGSPVAIKTGTNSGTGIQLQNAAGTALVNVDTTSGHVNIGGTTNSVFDAVGGGRPLVVQAGDSSTTVGGSGAAVVISNSGTTTNNTAQLNFAAITGANASQYSGAIIAAIFGARTNGQYPSGKLVFLTSSATNFAPTEKVRIDNNGNVGVGTPDQFGGGVGVLGLHNAGTNPSTDPTNGGILYVVAGALTYRGSGGTVTTLAPA